MKAKALCVLGMAFALAAGADAKQPGTPVLNARDLPFAVVLPKGAVVRLEPGLDQANYWITLAGNRPMQILSGQFITQDFAKNKAGAMNPIVQQRLACVWDSHGSAASGTRQVLYLDEAGEITGGTNFSFFLLVIEPLGLPIAKQAELDRVVSSIRTAHAGPIAAPALRSCQPGARPERLFRDSLLPPRHAPTRRR